MLLASCEPAPRRATTAPTVLVTARHVAGLLTAATPTRPGPTLAFAGHTASLDAECHCYTLKLPGHELSLYADATGALTEADIQPATAPRELSQSGTSHIDPARPRDTLAVRFAELVRVFGRWQGERHLLRSEAPSPYRTEFTYRNPATSRATEISASLKNPPANQRNSVYMLQFSITP
ncbi:hypothetical protein [Hymenobacter terrenus]|uniref:hypothetical protein n=1 Tax=Hymenobacter terrenus TaxID=1629124 RepID=UPI00061A09BD|nr:hypothetical protein [Hymenobacter terrenus]